MTRQDPSPDCMTVRDKFYHSPSITRLLLSTRPRPLDYASVPATHIILVYVAESSYYFVHVCLSLFVCVCITVFSVRWRWVDVRFSKSIRYSCDSLLIRPVLRQNAQLFDKPKFRLSAAIKYNSISFENCFSLETDVTTTLCLKKVPIFKLCNFVKS